MSPRLIRLTLALLLLAALVPRVRAGEPSAILRLWPGDAPATAPYDATDRLIFQPDDPSALKSVAGIQLPSMSVYLPATPARTGRPAIVICPGGGYSVETIRSGMSMAERLRGDGIVGVVLRYRLPEGKPPAAGQLPVAQQDVLRAIQLVRAHAGEWNVDPTKVGVIGFSAGGHLAASAATMFDQAGTLADRATNDAASKLSARPDFAALGYPVITMGDAAHAGSRRNLLGATPDDDLVARYSVERRVTEQTPPLFIFAAEDDASVPVENSVMMAAAAARARVPCTLLLFKAGGHGFGMGKPGSEAAVWYDAMTLWLRGRGVLASTTTRPAD